MDERRADLLAELLVTAADVAVTDDDPDGEPRDDTAAEDTAAEDTAAADTATEDTLPRAGPLVRQVEPGGSPRTPAPALALAEQVGGGRRCNRSLRASR